MESSNSFICPRVRAKYTPTLSLKLFRAKKNVGYSQSTDNDYKALSEVRNSLLKIGKTKQKCANLFCFLTF